MVDNLYLSVMEENQINCETTLQNGRGLTGRCDWMSGDL